MGESFKVELLLLEESVYRMGELATSMLKDSLRALEEGDKPVAESVIARAAEIEEMDARVEDEALRLLALYEPIARDKATIASTLKLARDMRTIVVSLKLITYIARVGKYAKDIAIHVRGIGAGGEGGNELAGKLSRMGGLVTEMVDDALNAFKVRDASSLSGFKDRDDEVDALFAELFSECKKGEAEKSPSEGQFMDRLMIARYLERCGDHACKMAEKVSYMVTGERMEIK